MEGKTWNVESLSAVGKMENILYILQIFKDTLSQQC